MATLGDELRRARQLLGLSQEQFGDALDPPVRRGTVNAWENNRQHPRAHLPQIYDMIRRGHRKRTDADKGESPPQPSEPPTPQEMSDAEIFVWIGELHAELARRLKERDSQRQIVVDPSRTQPDEWPVRERDEGLRHSEDTGA